MLFERSHAAHDPFMQEKRHAPFHSFLNVRAGGMNQFSNVLQDWFGEVSGLGNIGIDPRVFISHNASGHRNFLMAASKLGIAMTGHICSTGEATTKKHETIF